jgi:uncharacterized protein YbaR (Trm112 family)
VRTGFLHMLSCALAKDVRLLIKSRDRMTIYAAFFTNREPRKFPTTKEIPVLMTGGCPKCGNPNLMVPEDFSDDTIITCSKCNHKARWVEFFPRRRDN